MEIEIAEHGRMTESGRSLLRLIQNQNIPLLDLLVRESVQNSLDAAADGVDHVRINIITGDFNAECLNRHFDTIADALDRKYSGRQKFIAISDSGTVGLTGPVRYSDIKNNDFGNLLKLVYEISKPQQNAGSGGSWGLGKTIYFRTGTGLVIYYSRIRENGQYQSRLAACLVEDETAADTLIPYSGGVRRGIAWWGKKDDVSGSSTVPLDDENDIRGILEIFGIRPYENDVTGTTVIMPYIDENALLNEVYATNEAAEYRPGWTLSIQEYFRIAVQRWYAPRLLNAQYEYGPYLSASVNGVRLTVSGMLPLFRIVRELYIRATGKQPDAETLPVSGNDMPIVESILLRGVLEKTSAGKIAYAKFSRKQLGMEPPENEKTPHQQISNVYLSPENGNSPIVMFTRQPGMIVGYDYEGQWTHRMPRSEPDRYIICLFVADSKNRLKNIRDTETGNNMSLEEYIRQGEKADHASWTDRNIGGANPKIIAAIQRNVINKIRKKYTEVTPGSVQKQNTGLSHALANLLLPAHDFGNRADAGSAGTDNGGTLRGKRKGGISITSGLSYAARRMAMPFELRLRSTACLVSLQIITDFKRYEADVWEDESEIGREFPMMIDGIHINTVELLPKSGKGIHKVLLQVDSAYPKAENELLSLEIRKSRHLKTPCYFTVTSKTGKCNISGTLTFIFQDPSVKGSLGYQEMKS